MPTVQDYVGGGTFGAPSIHTSGRLTGLEIEIEGVVEFLRGDWGVPRPGSAMQYNSFWKVKGDGSLRNNGAEFMTDPVPPANVAAAIREFYDSWDRHPHWNGTTRCGIHSHIDVRDYQQHNFGALFTGYSLVVPALFEFVGPDREECIYCIPWYRAPNDADLLANKVLAPKMDLHTLIGTMEHGGYLRQRMSKYSAFYWSPVAWYGTVEFRQAPTWRDQDKLQAWASACWSIVDYCSTRTEEDILQEWRYDKHQFLRNLVRNNLPITQSAIDKVDFWDIEERVERLHKVPVEEQWALKMSESIVPKRSKRKASALDTVAGEVEALRAAINRDRIRSTFEWNPSPLPAARVIRARANVRIEPLPLQTFILDDEEHS